MRIPAFEIEQNRKKFYLTYMSAEQLSDETKVKTDTWSPDNREGYQRGLNAIRAKIFAKYIASPDNISPTAVLLSARESVEFESKEENYGILKIPSSSVLYEVDGQHRIGGLKEAIEKGELRNKIVLPVIIVCPVKLGEKEARNPRFCEAKQFVIINRTQKTVRADLSDRFIARLTNKQRDELKVLEKIFKDMDITPKAVSIADELNAKSGSPWNDRIRLPGERAGVASQRAFTNSLGPILRDPMLATLSYGELVDVLNEYWTAWKRLCPRAFDEPQHHVIQKTIGLSVLHTLFVEIAKFLKARDKDWTQDNFYEVLDKMSMGISDDFWRSHGEGGRTGTGKPQLRDLSRRLCDHFWASNSR